MNCPAPDNLTGYNSTNANNGFKIRMAEEKSMDDRKRVWQTDGSLAYMPVSFRQQGTSSFLFRLGSGEYVFDMAVRLPKPFAIASEYAAQPFVIAWVRYAISL